MATRSLQPSQYDIQREVEALRDIRRRSINPGALTIDPDLPNQSPPSSPTSFRLDDSPSTSGGDSALTGDSDGSSAASNSPADDPLHLFWVPARLHPELEPEQFKAFLREHARSPPSADGVSRSSSLSSGSAGLARKKSMLSRQYRPSENDDVENEQVVPVKKNRGSHSTDQDPQNTIGFWRKLEELAEEASESGDTTKLRNVLRRSLSLNLSPSAIDKIDDLTDMGDEADAPIIVPPPGQILRRTARTRIRKPGDNSGSRFGSTRRGAQARSQVAPAEPRTSSDVSSSDHGDSVESGPTSSRRRTFSDEGFTNKRPDSFSEEASIIESYARDQEEEVQPPVLIIPAPPEEETPPVQPLEPTPSQVRPELLEALGPAIHQPQPQHHLTPQPTDGQLPQVLPSRTPSPLEAVPTPPEIPIPTPPLPTPISVAPTPPNLHRKEKDKKSGLFGKWGSDKGAKKNGKAENKERPSEKEKESGFFGSLFGGSKKRQEHDPPPLGMHGAGAGREAAQALLGASKSKAQAALISPTVLTGPGVNPYARYPIHVERAIYRLSHIKLANPRRPLYEQVLISNLMFWYLGVINKAQNAAQPNGQAATAVPGQTAAPNQAIENQLSEKENEARGEQAEQREKVERERLEKEKHEPELEMKKKESGKRGSLTKTPAPGMPGSRRAETPIKGPQYEMQHMVMEQEYSAYNGQPMSTGRSASGSPASGNAQQYAWSHQPPSTSSSYGVPPKLVQPQPTQQPGDPFYYQSEQTPDHQAPRLPPGAMPPADQSSWQSTTIRSTPSASPGTSPGPQRSRSPPSAQSGSVSPDRASPAYIAGNVQGGGGGNARLPGRSLSATAVPSTQPMANGKLRKGVSAHAVPLSQGKRPRTSEGNHHESSAGGEEEDMPLAVWQQQRRR